MFRTALWGEKSVEFNTQTIQLIKRNGQINKNNRPLHISHRKTLSPEDKT